MKIIDAHAHIASWPSLKEAERLILLSEEKYGVAYSIVSNCDGAEFPSIGDPTPKGKSTLACLKETLAFQSRNKERIGALMWIRPYEEKPSEELVEYIKKNRKRILAIKFHPYEEHLSILSPKLVPWIKLARRFSFPLLVHCAADRYSSVLHLEKACRKYADLTFVAAHLELCTDNSRCIEIMKRTPNLYADSAWVKLDNVKRVLREVGIDRIMFGTDNPIDGLDTLDNPIYREYFSPGCGLSEKEKEHFFHLNAERVYGL